MFEDLMLILEDPIFLIGLVSASLLLNLLTLILVIVLLKRTKSNAISTRNGKLETAATIHTNQNNHTNHATPGAVGPGRPGTIGHGAVGIVFCRNCGRQYDSNYNVCPHCQR